VFGFGFIEVLIRFFGMNRDYQFEVVILYVISWIYVYKIEMYEKDDDL